MFLFSKPDQAFIKKFIDRSTSKELTYSDIGMTVEEKSPDGYAVDHNRISLGFGDEIWSRSRDLISNWTMFDLSWVDLFSKSTPIQIGENVAILIRHFGFWSLNNARIIYVIDETDRFGFAYGTLADHGESGEERFLVERINSTDEVFYDLFAFSSPGHILARLGYPYARYLQKRFAHDSKKKMIEALFREESA